MEKLVKEYRGWTMGEIHNGRQLEQASLLGIVLSFSLFPESVSKELFPDMKSLSEEEARQVTAHARDLVENFQNSTSSFFFALLNKSEPKVKESMREWVWKALMLNKSREHMNINHMTTSSSGMLFNLSHLLLQLSNKLLANEGYKQVDPLSCYSQLALDFENYAPIRHSDAVKKLISSSCEQRKQVNWKSFMQTSFGVSESFFLTGLSLHLGFLRSVSEYEEIMRTLSRIQQVAQRRGDDLRLKALIEKTYSVVYTWRAQLWSPTFLENALQFYLSFASWAIFLLSSAKVQPCEEGQESDAWLRFRCIPQFLFEDLVTFVVSMMHYSQVFPSTKKCYLLLTFVLTLLEQGDVCVNSPYLRGKLASLIYSISPSNENIDPNKKLAMSASFEAFQKHPMLMETGITSLVKLHNDVEFTGRHTQFYDKFSLRIEVLRLFKYLRTLPFYSRSLKKASQ